MRIERSPVFRQHFNERANKKVRRLLTERLKVFAKNPYDPSLRTHRLKYRWEGHWSFNVTEDLGTDDYRVIFRKIKGGYVFVDFGTHDQLYRPWKNKAA